MRLFYLKGRRKQLLFNYTCEPSGFWSVPTEPHENEIKATFRFEVERKSLGEAEMALKVDPTGNLKPIDLEDLNLKLIEAELNKRGHVSLDVSVSFRPCIELTE